VQSDLNCETAAIEVFWQVTLVVFAFNPFAQSDWYVEKPTKELKKVVFDEISMSAVVQLLE